MSLSSSTFAAVRFSARYGEPIVSSDRQFHAETAPAVHTGPMQEASELAPSMLQRTCPAEIMSRTEIAYPPHLIILKLLRGSPRFLSQYCRYHSGGKSPAVAGPLGLVFRQVQSGHCCFMVRWRSEAYPWIKFSCRFFSRVLLSLPKTVGAGYDALVCTEINRLSVHISLRMSAHPSPGASDLRSVNFGSGS